MHLLPQPEPAPAPIPRDWTLASAEELNAEMARLRQQVQHFEDAERQRQAQMWGGTSFAVMVGNYGARGLPMEGALLDPDNLGMLQQGYAEQQKKDAEALTRALGLLEKKVGPELFARIQAGGGYEVHSKWWPNVVYLVSKDPHVRVKVIADGTVVTEACIVSTDPYLPWPDIMLHRIMALELDESILFATGVLHKLRKGKGPIARLRSLFKGDDL